ncbi:MAG: TIGR01777 family oxidoreductase [Anaerolineales bacterium]
MKVLIAGGSGFIGRHLIRSLIADNHQVWVLSRSEKGIVGATPIRWDGETTKGWGHLMNEVDAVVNLAGLSLNSWPWTRRKKQRFLTSRVKPGLALASAIESAERKPGVFVQISGINHYGLRGDTLADESTPPADDFLAQLTVAWEESTASVETHGVRRVVCRTAVVLARDAVLLWLMALPTRLFFGGKLGRGSQALPWIHIHDQIGAIRFLMQEATASGAYNLIAPQQTSNETFMRTLAKVLQRPYWFHVPAFLLRMVLGEMSLLITAGRFAVPKRLLEAGYKIRFTHLEDALEDLFVSLNTRK